jgi:hypothetical protein
LPATIIILTIVNSQSEASQSPTLGTSSYLSYQYICWLTVPATRVSQYGTGAAGLPLPGTRQSTIFSSATANTKNALAAGVITEYPDYVNVPVGTAVSEVQSMLITSCGNQQTNLNAWNPWAHQGTAYNGTSWTVVTNP